MRAVQRCLVQLTKLTTLRRTPKVTMPTSGSAAADSDSPRAMLFHGQWLLGSIFSTNPATVLLCGVAAALVFLDLPAFFLGLYDMRTKPNGGFFFRPNWGPLYTVVLPAIFAGAAAMTRHVEAAIRDLSSEGIGVIVPTSSYPAGQSYSAAVASTL